MREHVNADRVVALTSELVSIDTRNPPGNEAPIEESVVKALADREPVWKRIEPEPGRVSLVAEIPHPEGPAKDRPVLIVNGHLDVVPVNAAMWSRDPFEPHLEDGKLFGRGSADMKGGVASAICALDALEKAGISPGCDLVFHFVADEERGGRVGTRALLEQGLIRGDACLIPEPTELQICVAERGLLHAYIRVEGRPGHGSRPREGISAIENAARLVLALHAADFGDSEHPLLGRPTANIGTITGGTTFNTVPETCTIGIDRRILPGATLEGTQAGIAELIEGVGVPHLRYEFDIDTFGEASEMPADDPFALLVGKAVAKATGSAPETIGMSFTTDARFVRNQAGIPAVVCGPGALAQMHGNDEYVTVESLVDATAAFAELYAMFGR